jgi:iron complex outermembrane receptor protein
VYGQFATSFVVPSLSALYVTGVTLQNLKPSTTTNYQLGTVFTRGAITADADVYLIEAANLEIGCTVPDATLPGGQAAAFCNVGKARYSGFEGEGAYAFDFGLTLFVNGSLNSARQLATPADPAAGIPTATVAQELPNAPAYTLAAGAIYNHGPWAASLTYKQVGPFVDYGTAVAFPAPGSVFHLPGYGSLDASATYDFGRAKVKLQVFNLLDARTISSYVPGTNSVALYPAAGLGNDGKPDGALYTFQAGRQIEVTLIAKF